MSSYNNVSPEDMLNKYIENVIDKRGLAQFVKDFFCSKEYIDYLKYLKGTTLTREKLEDIYKKIEFLNYQDSGETRLQFEQDLCSAIDEAKLLLRKTEKETLIYILDPGKNVPEKGHNFGVYTYFVKDLLSEEKKEDHLSIQLKVLKFLQDNRKEYIMDNMVKENLVKGDETEEEIYNDNKKADKYYNLGLKYLKELCLLDNNNKAVTDEVIKYRNKFITEYFIILAKFIPDIERLYNKIRKAN